MYHVSIPSACDPLPVGGKGLCRTKQDDGVDCCSNSDGIEIEDKMHRQICAVHKQMIVAVIVGKWLDKHPGVVLAMFRPRARQKKGALKIIQCVIWGKCP